MRKLVLVFCFLSVSVNAQKRQTSNVKISENYIIAEVGPFKSILFNYLGKGQYIGNYLALSKKLELKFKKYKAASNFSVNSSETPKLLKERIPLKRYNRKNFDIVCEITLFDASVKNTKLSVAPLQSYKYKVEIKNKRGYVVEIAELQVNTFRSREHNIPYVGNLIYDIIMK